jgi:hypothetical protein
VPLDQWTRDCLDAKAKVVLMSEEARP